MELIQSDQYAALAVSIQNKSKMFETELLFTSIPALCSGFRSVFGVRSRVLSFDWNGIRFDWKAESTSKLLINPPESDRSVGVGKNDLAGNGTHDRHKKCK